VASAIRFVRVKNDPESRMYNRTPRPGIKAMANIQVKRRAGVERSKKRIKKIDAMLRIYEISRAVEEILIVFVPFGSEN